MTSKALRSWDILGKLGQDMVAKLCNVYIFDTSKSGTFWYILTDRLEVGEGLRAGRCTSTSALAASLLVELFLACMVTDSVEKS